MTDRSRVDLVWTYTPCGRGTARLVVAAARAGATGVFDLSGPADQIRGQLERTAARLPGDATFAIRVPAGCDWRPDSIDGLTGLAERVATVVVEVGAGDANDLADLVASWRTGGRRVVAEVTSATEGRAAIGAGADGLVAKGSEAAGRVGTTGSFMLLQQLLADERTGDRPVWVLGGIGEHTAAAAVAGGAAGVVLGDQLILTNEGAAAWPADVRAAVEAMDGSETVVLDDRRVFLRPDLPSADLVGAAPDLTHAGGDADTADVVVARRTAAAEVDTLLAVGHTSPTIRRGLFAIGQDAALAAPLAARHRTVGGVVQAIAAAVERSIAEAVASDPLGPGSALATAHGLRHPIAQGPMTRVSDRAAFARSVADAGGLPFLALALMPGDEVRALLEETATVLGDRPWGVGILGFVPPEVRDQQLAVVHEIGPPTALIAGGRPTQAAPLDAAGIDTFLHVPSPGLLDRFLKDGARRFVFEGRECGGHVGPRPSFVLWQQQVLRLLAFADAGGTDGKGSLRGVEALFAGGVHDERSAAMVACLGADLVARDASIGVLMGTAYLFTDEAVAGGAIRPAFQAAAVDCERTVLLETSPGHATRCVDSDYVRTFRTEKQRLVGEGVPTQEMWAELEQLNLGRLRIASKGLVRDDRGLSEVEEEEQRREGMYMIGDVATVRHTKTTVADLHEQVSGGSSRYLHQRAHDLGVAPIDPSIVVHEVANPLDVAIVGMAGVFPGAPDVAQFWSNIVGGVDSVTEVPPERWDAGRYHGEANDPADAGMKTPSKWGGFLPDLPFDALAYGIPPASLASIDPMQLLALDVAAKALADAGYADRPFDRTRASVVFGAEAGTDLSNAYGFRSLLPAYAGRVPAALDDWLPRYTEDSFPGVLTNVIAGRIANRLDLGGINLTVDAACAASLAAVDLACKELTGGTSDLVLCGGADLHNGINDYLLFASVHALSPTGRCRTFDADADGIALGEGVACVVLKRLADAERDGDRVYAVIKGIAGSSDGRHLGLTAPRKEGQQLALYRAYGRAGISPAEVGLVEAHGTGTVVGDRTEMRTLTEVFEAYGAEPASCGLGSVKSNIGHTKCTAGLAGLIKAAHAVWRGIRPPTLHVTKPNSAYDPDGSPFVLYDAARPWIDDVRVAGVSAFGFGGTNFHAIVSSYDGDDPPTHGLDRWPSELLLFRGHDRDAARARIELVRSHVRAASDAGSPIDLGRVAAAVAEGGEGPVQVAVVATSVAELDDLLAAAVAGTPIAGRGGAGSVLVADAPSAGELSAAGNDAAAAGPGAVAFLFPGQGSQRPGMLSDLLVAFPGLQRHVTDPALAGLLFPPASFEPEQRSARQAAVTDTRVAQPVLGMAGSIVADVLGQVGVRPDMVGGHSYGELVALSVAGVFGADDLLDLSRARADAILAAAGDDPGTMAAVSGSTGEVEATLAGLSVDGVVVANRNAPNQSVISGPTPAVDAAIEGLAAAGLAAKRLPVACAFHSGVVAAARHALSGRLASVAMAAPSVPVWSNALAAPYDEDPDAIRATLARQVAEPVRWVEQIEAMYDAGARVFVEAGPGRVLTQLVGKILGDRPHVAVACDVNGEHGIDRLLLAVAQLAVAGVDVDPGVLFAGRVEPVDLVADPVVPPAWTVNGAVVKLRGAGVVAGGLPLMGDVPPLSVDALQGDTRMPGSAPIDATVIDYLQGMRELVAAQRDVMLTYLGSEPGVAIAPVPSARRDEVIEVASSALAVGGGDGAAVSAGTSGDGGADSGGGGAALSPADLLAAVLSIVAERTGYPTDMLDPDLDLEADLSIDSIKRIEILGELADRVGLPGAGENSLDESVVEELAQVKTIRGIVDWIVAADADAVGEADGEGAIEAAPASPDPTSTDPDLIDVGTASAASATESSGTSASVGIPPRSMRFHVRLAPAPIDGRDDDSVLAGRTFAIVDDGRAVALHLATRLEAHGARVRLHADGASLAEAVAAADAGSLDGVIDLAALALGAGVTARQVFPTVRAGALAGAHWILAASAMGGSLGRHRAEVGPDRPPTAPPNGKGAELSLPAGAGLPGLCRTVAREFPAARVRCVDLDPKVEPEALADALVEEILTSSGPVAVGRVGAQRVTTELVDEPSIDGADRVDGAAVALPGFDAESVMLLTGGGRGITARVATALAAATGGHVLLVGRSPQPDAEEAESTRLATDEKALRRVLVESGIGEPRQIEATVRRTMADREIRATLAAVGAVAASVTYRQCDVRDVDAVRVLVDDVVAQHGRLDLVVHGAGVLDDHFVRDKTPESFATVFDTKVAGACALADALGGRLRPDGSALTLALFGSIAGVFGNRGQVDYAAANDALDSLAWSLRAHAGLDAVAVDWGPWAGGGMVSPDLEREYARRGVGLLDPDDAVGRLLAELAPQRHREEPQVVVMRSRPDALEPGDG